MSEQESKEIELKLKVKDVELGERLLKDSLLKDLSQNASPRVKEYETIYYDTPDFQLLKHKVCYRIRNSAGKFTATIKGFGSSAQGLSQRSEWNRSLAEAQPTLEPFQDLPLGQELGQLIKNEELIPIFITRFKRTALDLTFSDGSLIELAFDVGEITTEHKKEPLCELELELKKGQVASILELGEILKERYSLIPEEKSKYQRGLELAGLGTQDI